jgi:hypothetical protein
LRCASAVSGGRGSEGQRARGKCGFGTGHRHVTGCRVCHIAVLPVCVTCVPGTSRPPHGGSRRHVRLRSGAPPLLCPSPPSAAFKRDQRVEALRQHRHSATCGVLVMDSVGWNHTSTRTRTHAHAHTHTNIHMVVGPWDGCERPAFRPALPQPGHPRTHSARPPRPPRVCVCQIHTRVCVCMWTIHRWAL